MLRRWLNKWSSKWSLVLAGVFILIGLGYGLEFNKLYLPTGLQAARLVGRPPARIGVVNLGKIRNEHPLTPQLRQLQQQLASSNLNLQGEEKNWLRIKETGNRQQKNFTEQADKSLLAIKQEYEAQIAVEQEKVATELTDYQQALQKEIKSKLERRQKKIEEEIKAEIAAEEQQLDQTIIEQKQKINQRYNNQIINLRLKLQMGLADKNEAADYKNKLNKLTAARNKKIKDVELKRQKQLTELTAEKEKYLKDELEKYRQKLVKQAEIDYKQHRRQVVAEWETKAAKLEKEFSQAIKNKQMSLEENWSRQWAATEQNLLEQETNKMKQIQKTIIQLQGSIEQLTEKREADINQLIEELAREKDFELVLAAESQQFTAVDLTKAVIKRLEGRNG